VNGKVRDRIVVPANVSEEEAKKVALASEAVQKMLEGREPRQLIYVKGRLVNIVI
jgi:leucyl-tRNA synthetase